MSNKKIAIVTHQMVMGGIEKSLIELCKQLQKKKFKITLYLEAEGGELYNSLPQDIEIIYIFKNCKSLKYLIKYFLENKEFKKVKALIKAVIINKLNKNPVKGWNQTIKYLDDDSQRYDYAFAYGAPLAFSTLYVAEKISAEKKYIWIHNDPSKISLSIEDYKEYYKKYNKIICVSESIKKKIDTIFKDYDINTEVFYNIIDSKMIIKKSEENINLDCFKGIKILTVGRLCHDKGQDIIPMILNRLKQENYNVRWYCVGDGEMQSYLEDIIRKLNLEDDLILLGNKNNPYPYFKMADIYVQTSRCEGFGLTLTEAKILNLPIITTNFEVAYEQIEDGKTGFIVNFNESDLFDAIKKLLDDSNYIDYFKNNLKNDSKSCVSKIDELLN